MNFLIDINHPCHVHLYKNLYFELSKRNKVFVSVKRIQSAITLLDILGIPYKSIGIKFDNHLLKSFSQLLFTWKVIKIIKKNQI